MSNFKISCFLSFAILISIKVYSQSPVSAPGFGNVCVTTGDVTWTNPGTVHTLLVFAKAGAAITTGTPSGNISTYSSASNDFSTPGTAYQNDANAFLVYKGTSGASVSLTGLTAGTTYHFLIFNANGTNYSTPVITSGSTLAALPDISGLSTTPGNGSLVLNWTNPLSCVDEILVVGRSGSAVTATPTGNGSAYTGSQTFGSGTDLGSSQFVIYKGTGNTETINASLTNGTTYHFTVFVRKGTTWSTGASVTGVPADVTPPTISVLDPADNAINIATDVVLKITFNENIAISAAATSTTDDTKILIKQGGTVEQTIDRASVTFTGSTATITLSPNLTLNNAVYHVLIGDKVFTDISGNAFTGISNTTDWNFTTSPGVTLTTGTATANISTFTTLSNIVITENGKNDFAIGTSKTLKLAFNGSGYIFDATATPTLSFGTNDITTASVTAIDFTSVVITYTVASTNNLDALTISGLKVKTSSTANPPINILRVAGSSDGTITDVQVGSAVVGTVSACSTAAPGLAANGGDANLCLNETLSGLSVQATGAGTIEWFNDAGLTSEITALQGNNNPSVSALGFTTTPAGTQTRYATLTSGCQSSAAVFTLTINPLPVANAGTDLTGASAICPGSPVTVGGNPTLVTPTTLPPYTYTWTEPSGFIAGFSTSNSSNPTIPGASITNPTGATRNYNFRVVITDANGCQSSPDIMTVAVKDLSQVVTITSPPQFNFADTDNPVTLTGNPAGGTFSGPGVVIQGGTSIYKFDPQNASIVGSPHTISYTTTLTNGCTKTITQLFNVTSGSFVIPQLPVNQNYCNNEPQSAILDLNPAYKTILSNAGYVLVRFESDLPGLVGPLPTEPALILTQRFSPVVAGAGIVNPRQHRIYAVIRYAPDPPGSEYRWVSDVVTVNPIPNVFFTGLNSGIPANPNAFCNESGSFQLSGNFTGGNFLASTDNSTFSNVAGLTDGAPGPGQAIFNPLPAYAIAPGVGSKSFYIKYIYDPGTIGSNNASCSNSQTQTISINPLPSISFTIAPANSDIFCNEESPVTLQTDKTSNIILFGQGVSDQGGGKGTFTPKAAFTLREQELNTVPLTSGENFVITATHTDNIGCKNSDVRTVQVRPIPPATFTFGAKTNFCYQDGTTPPTFTGQQFNGRYLLQFAGLPLADSVVNSKDLYFDFNFLFRQAVNHGASPLSTVNITVIYTANDNIKSSCINTMSQVFRISPNLPVTIAGIEDANTKIYCANEGPFTLTLSPPNGNLTISSDGGLNYGPAETLTNGGSKFILDRPSGGDFLLKYEVVTGAGCTNSSTKNVKLLPSPLAIFNVPPQCDGTTINFVSQNNSNAAVYQWSFGDSSPNGINASEQHQYPSPSLYNVRLTIDAIPQFGITCTSTATQDVTVGTNPLGSFDIIKVCAGDQTDFKAKSSNVGLSTVGWDFGDGDLLTISPTNFSASAIPAGTHGGRTTGTYGNPVHVYANEGTYSVVMDAKTSPAQGACLTTVPKSISILKNIVPTAALPYAMSTLNNGDGFWKVEDVNGKSTWAFAAPTGKKVITSTNATWITNPSGNYNAEDFSYVNSPCFDLTGFTKPSISLDYWIDADTRKDGAVLQSSLNGGQTWQRVGDLTSGLNWYNVPFISSTPGNETQLGWSDATNGWLNGKNSINNLIQPKVRFRIAFSSDERVEADGFAFNNVKIEERNRFILLENFTNEKSPKAANNNQGFVNFSSPEIVKIQYHTGFPGNDAINLQNSTDHNARSAFYGLTNNTSNIPQGYIDGMSGGDFTTNWYSSDSQLRSLESSPMTIQINNPTASNNVIAAQVSITSLDVITSKKLAVFVAIVEKQTGTYQFVLRKFLPSASGTMLTTPIAKGTTIDLPVMTWEVSNGVNPQNLAIVAFVQDIDASGPGRRDILQSNILLNPANLPSLVTAIEVPFLTSEIYSYPNPTDHELTVQLPFTAKAEVPVLLSDQLGKIVHRSSIKAGDQSKTISTRELAEGLYVLQIETDGRMTRSKVIVVHKE